MKKELNILNLEDDIDDAELIERELCKGGFPFRLKRVVTQEDFLLALREVRPDVILSDHGLPVFNGFEALAVARKECPDVPFIFVTGLMGEEKEIDTFERGAIDYVLKSRLSRLVPVVRRAVREAEQRAERRNQERALRENEERFRALVEGVKDYAICMLDREGRVSSWNVGAEWIEGYQAREIIGRHYSCFFPPEAVAGGLPERALARAVVEGRLEEEGLLLRKGGAPFWAEVVITALRDQQRELYGFALVMRDITPRKQAEAERERLIRELQTTISDVKSLSGLLPICASCKKVRDYRGMWHPLEAYLRDHSEATLTHEFCQELRSAYPAGGFIRLNTRCCAPRCRTASSKLSRRGGRGVQPPAQSVLKT
jgi:PAS domain S-box-containing protein